MRLIVPTFAVLMLSMSHAPATAACRGDCGGDGVVTINELVRAVAIALGSAPAGDCAAVDGDGDGRVTVAELIGAVNSVLEGCDGAAATPTPTPTGAPNLTPTVFVPGCDNGQVSFAYSQVADTNAITTPLELSLVAGAEIRDARTGLYVWQITALQCTGNEFTLGRSLQLQFVGVNSPIAAGVTVDIKASGFPLPLIVYGELQDPNVFLRTWRPASGTLTIEAVEGNRVEFHFVGNMVPYPLGSFGEQPTGSFTLDARGVIENVVRS